jgi:hypothetical protein
MHRSRICGAPIVSPVAFVACGLWRSNTLETAMGYDAVLHAVFSSCRSFFIKFVLRLSISQAKNQPIIKPTNKCIVRCVIIQIFILQFYPPFICRFFAKTIYEARKN